MNVDRFFDSLWDDYVAIAPQAARIRDAFLARGERVVNDHVAFRTLAAGPIGLERLERHLRELGYRPYAPYDFPDKKLRARGYLQQYSRNPSSSRPALTPSLCSGVKVGTGRRLGPHSTPSVLISAFAAEWYEPVPARKRIISIDLR